MVAGGFLILGLRFLGGYFHSWYGKYSKYPINLPGFITPSKSVVVGLGISEPSTVSHILSRRKPLLLLKLHQVQNSAAKHF